MTMNWNELKKRITIPMKFKQGQKVEWVGTLSMGVPWHFIGWYKGCHDGKAVIEMRSGAIVEVEKEKLRYADE